MRPFSQYRSSVPKRVTATSVIVAALGVGALFGLLFPYAARYLDFNPLLALSRPWSYFTYPLTVPLEGGFAGPIFTVFLLLWVYQIGTQIESALGMPRFIGLWLAGTLLPAILFTIPGTQAPLSGPMLPVAVLTVAWATRNANSQLMIFGIVPLAAKWIGAIFALGVFARYYPLGVAPALVSLLPLALTYAFAAEKIPGLAWAAPAVNRKKSKEEKRKEIDFLDEVRKREKERDEKERLRRLLEGPSADDDSAGTRR